METNEESYEDEEETVTEEMEIEEPEVKPYQVQVWRNAEMVGNWSFSTVKEAEDEMDEIVADAYSDELNFGEFPWTSVALLHNGNVLSERVAPDLRAMQEEVMEVVNG